MKFGISLPPFGDYADIHHLAAMAKTAEDVGWDGFFLWDHVFFDPSFHPNVDPWVALAAIALNTRQIRIGTLVTPLARRRPWNLARQTVAIDRLSGGRLTLGVGLGEPAQWDFSFFNEETDPEVRAKKLDEGLKVLTGLWTGEPFHYEGEHYQVKAVKFSPTPMQSPRIPIWVGGVWPNKPPMRRAAQWDGFFPIHWQGGMTPETWKDTMAYIKEYRVTTTPFDLVNGGKVPDDQWKHSEAIVQPYAEVGVTWWIEDVSPWRFGHSWESQWSPEFTQQMDDLIRLGPPIP